MTSIPSNFLPRLISPQAHQNKWPNHLIKRAITVKANQNDDCNDHEKSVDENMIVLRMRIKKMKDWESIGNDASRSSSDWPEWEKKLSLHYHENICNSLEFLQSYLMKTRPNVALGMLMLVAMSVPFSTLVVVVNSLQVAKGLLAGCHVCIDIDLIQLGNACFMR